MIPKSYTKEKKKKKKVGLLLSPSLFLSPALNLNSYYITTQSPKPHKEEYISFLEKVHLHVGLQLLCFKRTFHS